MIHARRATALRGGMRARFAAATSILTAAWCLGIAAASGNPPGADSIGTGRAARPHYADGAAPGFSGGFGEQACDACHFEAAINTPPGAVTIDGVPERFAPGERYPLTISLSRTASKLGGFQFAARFEDGTQAGTLTIGTGEETRIKIEAQSGIQYANQRTAGTTPGELGRLQWTLIWTAPDATRAVVFHAAANAANGDESALGDYVYTAAAKSGPR